MSGGNVVIATFKTKTVGIQFAVNDGFARTHDVSVVSGSWMGDCRLL